MTEMCGNCGKPVLVQIQKNTGYCRPKCQEQATGKLPATK